MRVLLLYRNPARDLLPAPPIGLAYVATATRRAGHEVSFLDLVGSGRPLEDARERLAAFAPDVIGISIRNIDNLVRQRSAWHLEDGARLAAVIRQSCAAPIVVGGPAVSILGAAALRHVAADFAVVGEGEETFPRLLSALASGRPASGIPGVCGRGGDGVVTPAARLPHFGASGMEDWIDWSAYERAGATWPIQTRRGCPLTCSYCAYPAVEGRVARRRAPADVADEIERVRARLGPRTFEFVDSTFNVPPQHAEAVCEELVRRRLRVRLTAMGVNPLGVSGRLFAAMRRAGFNSMMITPEAASEGMLRSLGKGFVVEDVRRTAREARASGITSMWFFMLGGPGETHQTVDETMSFVERHLDWPGCVSVFMTGIRVLPGTALARDAVREGALAADRDLAETTFYLSPDVDEDWVLGRINQAMRRCPGIVHAAEEGGSTYERVVDRALAAAGVAPPYWRFLPLLLRIPPVAALRRRRPPLGKPGPRAPHPPDP
jgi:radical SAM superfamily enzyme YgiQ (UPF0313 family)